MTFWKLWNFPLLSENRKKSNEKHSERFLLQIREESFNLQSRKSQIVLCKGSHLSMQQMINDPCVRFEGPAGHSDQRLGCKITRF